MQNEEAPLSSADTASADDALRRERDEYYDRLLRVTAEFDNYRKRTDRERRDRAESAGMDVVRDILPIVDDLERALDAAAERETDPLREGVELIHRQILDLLKRRGVEPFDAVGADFDPEWHEAVAHEPASDRRDGEVTAEIRRGYRIGEKLLRPAMVRVAKA